MSQAKEELIYFCASEAVTRARIAIRQLLDGSVDNETLDSVETILSRAARHAGTWAVKAYESDARKARHQDICNGSDK